MAPSSNTEELPSTFKAWRMHSVVKTKEALTNEQAVGKSIVLEQVSLPTLEPGQVLIKVARCTINNADLLHLCGSYVNAEHIPLPRPLGFEGSGIVVQSKAPWYLPQVGARVAFYVDNAGALDEYLVCDAMTVTKIPSGAVSYATAACSVANAFTVILMVDKVKKAGHKIFINTAAAGSLGRLMIKYAKTVGLDVIGIVRSDEQKEICQQEGAAFVLNMKDEDFDSQLAKIAQETNCRFAFDALGGDMPNRLLQALPPSSVVSVYSNIVSDDSIINMNNLFDDKRFEAFNAATEAKKLWTIQLLMIIHKLQKWMTIPEMTTAVRKSFQFEELPEAIAYTASESKTAGKIQVIVNSSIEPQ